MLGLYYQEYGDKDGPLMIFLHGGGVSSWMWDRQVQYFTDYHCVTVDLPEQGKSRTRADFSINDSSQKLIRLVENIANEKDIIVVGFSLGAQVLIQMLSIKPDLIDYAIINSALVRPSKIGEILINPLIRLSFPLIKNKIFSKFQAKALYINEEYFEEYYHESSQMERDTLIRILKENVSFEIPREFCKAKGKILVIVGNKERQIMKKSAIEIVNNNQNCTGMIISKIGHGLPLAKPKLFNNIIEKWIKNDAKIKLIM